MRKAIILTLTMGMFIIVGSLYAASGDLVVNGNLTLSGTVNGSTISSTPAANAVPVRDANGDLSPGALGRLTSNNKTIDCGTVTNGDIIAVQWWVDSVLTSGATEVDVSISKASGTATIQTYIMGGGYRALVGTTVRYDFSTRGPSKAAHTINGLIFVTGSGTLTLGSNKVAYGTAPTYSDEQWNVWFVKKQ